MLHGLWDLVFCNICYVTFLSCVFLIIYADLLRIKCETLKLILIFFSDLVLL